MLLMECGTIPIYVANPNRIAFIALKNINYHKMPQFK